MTSKNPEFQQKLRWSLGVTVGKLTTLVVTSLLTAYCWRIVFHDRRTIQEEVEQSRAQYQVKAEYKQDSGSRGSMRKVPARNSYRRTVSEDVYSIPLSGSSMLPASGGGGREGECVPVPASRAIDEGEGYTRQTSMDTTYNVPSIRTEVSGPVMPRFDSILEMEGEAEGKRNDGFLL